MNFTLRPFLLAILMTSHLLSIGQIQSKLVDQPQYLEKLKVKLQSPRIDGLLLRTCNQYLKALDQGISPSDFSPNWNYLPYVNGLVAIDFTCSKPDLLLEELKVLGIQNESVFKHVISGLFPLKNVPQLNACKYLHRAAGAYSKTNAGIVISQGDTAMGSQLVRENLGFNGSGIKVGVLSDSYNANGGALATTFLGDLPGPANPEGNVQEVEVLEDAFSGIDEGRAMLEIIHDVAPGADLAFHTAVFGQANFAEGIIALADSGADIITDDIIYFAESMFQDGIIAQAVDSVNKIGKAYFSSAGNNGLISINYNYVPSGINDTVPLFDFLSSEIIDDTLINKEIVSDTLITEFHDFGNGEIFQPFKLLPGESFFLLAQWNQPSFTATGGVGALSDIDFLIFDASGENFIDGTFDFNIGGDPVEFFSFFNFTEDSLFNLAIVRYEGPDPDQIQLVPFDISPDLLAELGNDVGTTYGHANAEGAIATGAAPYFLTPAFGVDTPLLEPFSSAGGIPILIDLNDNSIDPVIRNKPEIVGPDGANTTFFLAQVDLEGDRFPNFPGTSASAPHIAAVGALMLEAKPDLSPSEMLDIMQRTAIDMDNPLTLEFDRGFDFASGTGLINAFDAVTVAAGIPLVVDFTLVNTESDAPIPTFDPIPDGAEINLSELDTKLLSVVANTVPSNVGSIKFELNGSFNKTQVENVRPYALFGDDATGDFFPPSDKFQNGQSFTLTATPFSESNLQGIRGNAATISFTFTEEDPQSAIAARKRNSFQEIESIQLYPNPSKGLITITTEFQDIATINVYNTLGQLNHTEKIDLVNSQQLDLSELGQGIFIINIQTTEENYTTRLILTE